MKSIHIPVLVEEVTTGLTGGLSSTAKVLTYLDGTAGGGGHILSIVKSLGGKVRVIALDRDGQALERTKDKIEGSLDVSVGGQIILEKENFRNLDTVLDKHSIPTVDLILLDIGISSDELENSGRGFSFVKDEPLLMTMGEPESYPFAARDIVNGWKEEDIANVIFGYGEERYARRIARAIVTYREEVGEIQTTFELVEIVKSAVPFMYRRGKIHPATRTFQALRIAVNDELGALREGLKKGYDRLAPQGRMAVISFHSLEDRIVKDFYKEKELSEGAIVSRKPIQASEEETYTNPRSRSAKLRILQKK